MKFEDSKLHPQIKANLAELGFKRPTDIQIKAIPPIIRGEDVLAIAQTGTGKTAAFAIPVLDILKNRGGRTSAEPGTVRCLIMCPTHELALQIRQVFDQIGKGLELKTLAMYGGVDQAPQIAQLKKGVDVLVTTPGRMFDLASQGHLYLRRVSILILDEADHMLDLGFIGDIRAMMKMLPQKRQTLFFSATINERIKKLAYSLVQGNAIRIQISPKDPVSKNVGHAVTFVEMDDKRFFLERFINEHPESKMLVFVRTKVRADRVVAAMARVGINSNSIHGGKEQKDRNRVLEEFRSGSNSVLIATDVTARGIDIPNVDYVINYDLPDVAENYVHRVGRTGRGKMKGIALSFCSPEEKSLLEEIEEFTGKKIEVFKVEKAEYRETVAMTEDGPKDWRKLMQAAEEENSRRKNKPFKKGKGKISGPK